MKIIVQKVKYAICKKEKEIINVIGYGIVAYLGISNEDTEITVDYLVNKLLKIRLYDGWTKTVTEKNFDLLVLFEKSLSDKLLENPKAQKIYDTFFEKIKKSYDCGIVKKVSFDDQFSINVCNQGPCTFVLNK